MRDITKDYPEVSEAIRTAFFETGSELDEFGIFDADRVTEISASSYPGFIPFTNGGFDAMIMQDLRNSWGSGMMGERETEIITPFIESCQRDAAHEFIMCRDELEHLRDATTYDNADAVLWEYFDNAETEHGNRAAAYPDGDLLGDKLPEFWRTPEGALREEYFEFESEYMSEGGEYWLQFRANFFAADNRRNVTGDDEIYFIAAVNTDFTYGRDSGMQDTFSRTYKAKHLTPARVRVIVEAMRASL